MADRDTDRYMEENGFKFIRSTRVGQMWGDGYTTVVVADSVNKNYRNWQNTMAEVRRAVRKREIEQAGLTPHQQRAQTERFFEKKPLAKLGDVVKGAPIVNRKANGEVKEIKPAVNHDQAQREFAKMQLNKPEPPTPAPPPNATPEETEVKRKKIRRFDVTTREVIKIRMGELLDQNISNPVQIKSVLDKEGFKMNNGDPMDLKWIKFNLNILHNERQVKKFKQPPAPAATAPVTPPPVQQAPMHSKLPQFVLAILKDQTMSDAKKIKLLLTYAEE